MLDIKIEKKVSEDSVDDANADAYYRLMKHHTELEGIACLAYISADGKKLMDGCDIAGDKLRVNKIIDGITSDRATILRKDNVHFILIAGGTPLYLKDDVEIGVNLRRGKAWDNVAGRIPDDTVIYILGEDMKEDVMRLPGR